MTALDDLRTRPGRTTTTALFTGEDTVTGHVRATTTGSGAAWADQVVASLAPGERALVVLDFVPDGPAVAHYCTGPTTGTPAAPAAGEVANGRHTVTQRPSPDRYADTVRAALDLIAAGQVQKVVLGRSLDVVSDPPLDPATVLHRLLADRPGRYVFGVPLTASPDGPLLVGASPELLVRRRGRDVTSFPLAGSVPRVPDDPAADLANAQRLLGSAKDRAEHAFVVDAVVEALTPVCEDVTADASPRLVATDTVYHLGTRITATLPDCAAGPSALRLARLLHPTPAVGGTPRAAALDVIADLEDGRGPLTGAVGWVDGDGDGEFAVTIRAGVLHGSRLRLYAGAGVVAGSDPDAEVRETAAKLATMMRAVGL